jgi:hypothetical protein
VRLAFGLILISVSIAVALLIKYRNPKFFIKNENDVRKKRFLSLKEAKESFQKCVKSLKNLAHRGKKLIFK